MKSNWFVEPEITQLPLSGGEWIRVKKYLTAGETRLMYRRMYRAGVDGRDEVDPLKVGFAKVVTYLVDWSLTAADGAPILLRDMDEDQVVSYLENLFPERFKELEDAIDRHEAAVAEEKKILNGDRTSSPTFESRGSTDGGTNGSIRSTAMSTA
jgi:hypothetical protein